MYVPTTDCFLNSNRMLWSNAEHYIQEWKLDEAAFQFLKHRQLSTYYLEALITLGGRLKSRQVNTRSMQLKGRTDFQGVDTTQRCDLYLPPFDGGPTRVTASFLMNMQTRRLPYEREWVICFTVKMRASSYARANVLARHKTKNVPCAGFISVRVGLRRIAG